MEEKRWLISHKERPQRGFTELTIHRPRWPKSSVQLSWARRYSICNSDRQRLVHNFLSSSRENPWLRSELPKFTHDRNQETSLVLAPYSLRGLEQGKFLSDMASEEVLQQTGTTQSFDDPLLLPRMQSYLPALQHQSCCALPQDRKTAKDQTSLYGFPLSKKGPRIQDTLPKPRDDCHPCPWSLLPSTVREKPASRGSRGQPS